MSDIITVKDLNLWSGPTQALHHVTISVPEHSITAILGSSSRGHSTVLTTTVQMDVLLQQGKVEAPGPTKGQDS